MAVKLRAWRRWICTVYLMNVLCNSLIYAEIQQRAFSAESEDEEALIIRKDRQANVAGYNSFVNWVNLFLSGFYVTTSSSTNTSTITITPQFWTTFFNILQYFTFFVWFFLVLFIYVFGVLILFLFAIISPVCTGVGNQTVGNYNGGICSGQIWNGALFRSFEDENMPLFDKVTSVGYGFVDRASELTSLAANPQCTRYAICHLSATLGDQEANGFSFKDMFRAISSTLDNKAGTEGMTRSVNVGLLTGECENEPLMSCPELAPYFKRISESWSSYL